MDDHVERLLRAYISEHRSGGEADPTAYLRQLEGREREELRVLIDGYLQRAPAREYDPQAFARDRETAPMRDLARWVEQSSGRWPELLPELRNRARLPRKELVGRLAEALGFPGSEEKVGLYYHEMEQGLLPERGVSDRVLEALAAILGVQAATLREAGRALVSRPAPPGEPGPAMLRLGFPRGEAVTEAPPAGAPATASPPDEVDLLFTGGPAA